MSGTRVTKSKRCHLLLRLYVLQLHVPPVIVAIVAVVAVVAVRASVAVVAVVAMVIGILPCFSPAVRADRW